MDNKPSKEISRRDAMKVLAAVAGAAALANLPSKWSTPELATGVLPAHAQTSNPLPLYSLAAGADEPESNFCQDLTSTVTITPPASGINLRYVITPSAGVTINSPALTATALTDASGMVTLPISVGSFGLDDTVTVTWSFVNASDGTNTDGQVFTSIGSGC
jgi:hypothetical protein